MKIKGINHNKKDKQGRNFRRHLDKKVNDEDEVTNVNEDNKPKSVMNINVDRKIEIKEREKSDISYPKEDEDKDRSVAIDIII